MMLRNISSSILACVWREHGRGRSASTAVPRHTDVADVCGPSPRATRYTDVLRPIGTSAVRFHEMRQHEGSARARRTATPRSRRSALWFITAAVLLGVGLSTFVAHPEGQVRLPRLGSPTGREPRLIWTPERQGIWSQMRSDFEASPQAPRTLGGQYFKLIKDNAECKCRYADTGLWATLMFQMTGDRKY